MRILSTTAATYTDAGSPYTVDVDLGGYAAPSGTTVMVLVETTDTVSGTSPTFDLEESWSSGGKDQFYANGTENTFTQMTAAGAEAVSYTVYGSVLRLTVTIGGTATPTFPVRITVLG